MKKRNLMAILACTVCLTAASVGAPAAMAEETEAVTEAATEAATEAEEAATEAAEADTEAQEDSTEETYEKIPRPDYKASDYVELGEYKGLTVKIAPIEVTDEEILAQIKADAGSDALEEITEGTVEEGDTANIDYVGKLDGEAFDGGTAKGYDLEIGSGTFIDGFEDGLIGAKIGDTIDLTLIFPENYGSEELAGKETVFTVTVNSVKRMKELTDEVVSTLTDGEYTDVATYKESIKETLLKSKEDSRDNEIKSDILSQISANCTIKDYPQEMLDYGLTNMQNAYKQMAAQYDMEYADLLQNYFGMTEEQFNEEALSAVKQNLSAEMYLKAIAEKEGIEISEEDYEAACQRYADTYGYDSADDLKAAYDEDTIRISALQDKVLDFLEENTTVEETTETEASTEAAEKETAEAGTEAGTEAQTEAAEAGTEAAAEAVTEAATEASTEAAE